MRSSAHVDDAAAAAAAATTSASSASGRADDDGGEEAEDDDLDVDQEGDVDGAGGAEALKEAVARAENGNATSETSSSATASSRPGEGDASDPKQKSSGKEDASLRVDDVLEYRARLIREALRGVLEQGGSGSSSSTSTSVTKGGSAAVSAAETKAQDTSLDALLKRFSVAQTREFWAWTAQTFSAGMASLLRAPVLPPSTPRRALFVSRVLGDLCTLRERKMETQAKGSQFYAYVEAFGLINVDLMLDVKDMYKLASSALKWVAAHVMPGSADSQKIDLDYARMFALYEGGTFDGLAEIGVYAARDTVVPLLITAKLRVLERLLCLSRVTSTQPQACQNSGQQLRVITTLARRIHRRWGLCSGDSGWPQSGGAGAQAAAKAAAFATGGGAARGGGGPASRGGALSRGSASGKGGGSGAAKRKRVQYVGARVLDPVPGFYVDPVSTLDFASLYPSIMGSRGLCPSALASAEDAARVRAAPNGLGMVEEFVVQHVADDGSTFPRSYFIVQNELAPVVEMLDYLVAERRRVKALMAAAEGTPMETVYDKLQEALKVVCNSTYGFFGCDAATGRLSCMPLAAITTMIGRDMIDATKTFAEAAVRNSRVIYGDTDSIMLLHPPKTSLAAAHARSVALADEITEGMRQGDGVFALGGAPHWRKVQKTLFDAAVAKAGDAAYTAFLASHSSSNSSSSSNNSSSNEDPINTPGAEEARAAASAARATELRPRLRDFGPACKVLKIESEKVSLA